MLDGGAMLNSCLACSSQPPSSSGDVTEVKGIQRESVNPETNIVSNGADASNTDKNINSDNNMHNDDFNKISLT